MTRFSYQHAKPEQIQALRQLESALLPQQLFTWQESVLRESGVLAGQDLLYLAPTGSGKTSVGNGAMVGTLAAGKAVLVLVSTRALARERGAALAQVLAPLGFRVGISTRDDRADDEAIRSGIVDVIVTVYEKAQSLVVAGGIGPGRVGLVVADEAQLLLDPERGTPASLVLEVWRGLPSAPQLVALSAALGRTAELEAALGLRAVITPERAVPLSIGTIRLDKGEAAWVEPDGEARTRSIGAPLSADEDPSDLLHQLIEGAEKPVLAFFPTRREAIAAARALAERSHESLEVVLEEQVAEGAVGALLARGVGLHTAEQTRAERRAVEQLLRDGRLGICCCTTTLAEGINLQARTVFYVPGPEDDATRRENCLGRAGRPGAGKGTAWIVSRGNGAGGSRRRPVKSCAVSLAAFLLAAGWDVKRVAERLARLALGTQEDPLALGQRLGMWDGDGTLSPQGHLLARGGLVADAVAGWRTSLRRFPSGGSEAANLFLAIGGARAAEALPLTSDERVSARWVLELAEELAARPDPLSDYFQEFLSSPDALPRRIHQAAKGVLLVLAHRRGVGLARLESDFLTPAGLVEEFVDQSSFLAGQLARLARELGGDMAVPDSPAATTAPRPAVVVPIHATEAPRAKLVLRLGSAGAVLYDGKPVHLTYLQFRMLELLARNAGEGVPYERLESFLWRGIPAERQQISYHKTKLERRLEEARGTRGPRLIETLASWGIRLAMDRSDVVIEEVPSDEHLVLRDSSDHDGTNSVAWTICL